MFRRVGAGTPGGARLKPPLDVGEPALGHELGGELRLVTPEDKVVELGLLPVVRGDPG